MRFSAVGDVDAAGAELLQPVARVRHRHRAALGEAVRLADRRAEDPLELDQELLRHLGRSAERVADRADAVPREGVLLGEHHLVHGRDAREVGHLVAVDGADDLDRVEAGEDHERAAGEEERLHRADHRVLVVERHRDERALRVVEARHLPDDVGVPDLAAVGEQDALGLAGGAGGVGLHAHRVRVEPAAPEARRRGGEPGVPAEGAVGGRRVDDEVGQPLDLAREAPGALGLVAAGHQHRRLGVLDDVGERLVPHPDVQRDGHRADPHGAQERREEPPVVREHQRDAVAGAHAEARVGVRGAVAPGVEVPVGEGRVALDHGDRRRREPEGTSKTWPRVSKGGTSSVSTGRPEDRGSSPGHIASGDLLAGRRIRTSLPATLSRGRAVASDGDVFIRPPIVHGQSVHARSARAREVIAPRGVTPRPSRHDRRPRAGPRRGV